jgi:serine/threonine protein kinase
MVLGPGSRVGPYEIIAFIGAGTIGEVYRARDRRSKYDVALKVLPEFFAAHPERLARFQGEAQAISSLNHPNIAAIHGFETANGLRALVMELVHGQTLAERVASGPIAVDESLAIATQIADALHAAHRRGIIHGDLKPSNVKVQPDGLVRVLDFGVISVFEPEPMTRSSPRSRGSPSRAARLFGAIGGTAAYMSPEQARGSPPDRSSDIWAFGCVLYEMLTGRQAFSGDDVAATLAATLKGDADWSVLPPTMPGAVRELLRSCLDRNPTTRLQNIDEACNVMKDAISVAASIGDDLRQSVLARLSIDRDLQEPLETPRREMKRGIDVLLQRLLPGLKRWARRSVPEAEGLDLDTDAIVDDVAARASPHVGQFDPRDVDTLRDYLRVAIRNQIRDEWRGKARAPVDPAKTARRLAVEHRFEPVRILLSRIVQWAMNLLRRNKSGA